MNCRDLIDGLDDYVDDGLPPPRREACDDHLRQCPQCRDYLREYQETVRLVRSLGEQPAAPAAAPVPAELVDAIRESLRRSTRGPGDPPAAQP